MVASGAAPTARDWEGLGVRPEAVDAWRSLGVDAFVAALAQGDGYGPSSARHAMRLLVTVASAWRAAGLASAEGLRWHRAGFGPSAAREWLARGVTLDEAALAAGHRMVG